MSREFVVPAGIRLAEFHEVIQDVMGWCNCHLYVFHTSQGEFGVKDPDYDDDMQSDKTVVLADIVTPEDPVSYYEYVRQQGKARSGLAQKLLSKLARKLPARLP